MNVFRENNIFQRVEDNVARNYPPHIHSEIEVTLIKSGNGFAKCDDKIVELHPGAVFLSCPNQVHSYFGFDETLDNKLFSFLIQPNNLLDYSYIFANKIPTSPYCFPKNSAIYDLFNIASKKKPYTLVEDANTKVLLTAILGELMQYYDFVDSIARDSRVADILNYCNSHYHEDLSLDKLSKELYMSRSQISSIFNNKFDISFNDYINQLRLAEAVKRINQNTDNIYEIAFQVGFNSIRTFNRAFQKRYELSPREYRAKKERITKEKEQA